MLKLSQVSKSFDDRRVARIDVSLEVAEVSCCLWWARVAVARRRCCA